MKSEPAAKFFLESLDIPEDYELNLIIAIGYPDEQPEAKPRDEGKVKFIRTISTKIRQAIVICQSRCLSLHVRQRKRNNGLEMEDSGKKEFWT
mgnify:CR=1 FL=1